MVFHLPGGGSAGAFGELLFHGPGLHQLAGLSLTMFVILLGVRE